VSTNLTWIGDKARDCPDLVFTSLYHHVTDLDNMRTCFNDLPAKRAVGIDNVKKEEYGEKLEENLQDLSARLARMGYRPKAKRRSYIPKAGSPKGRPLGISCFEDKLVEASTKRALEPIYETMFKDFSYGYRPGRSQHDCLDALGRTIQQNTIRYVVEADIRGFFDKVNHEWMIKFLEHRIGDQRVLRLIKRMLKSGMMEDGLTKATTEGTPQGSILSPLLSNIYLHYVLDIWFPAKIAPQCHGKSFLFRYADDFVVCFERKEDAERFIPALRQRLEKFSLQLAEEKTRCLPFGKFSREDAQRRGEKPAEFTFLGLTHYMGKTRKGWAKVKRRTSRKKLQQGLSKLKDWMRKSRSVITTNEFLRAAKIRVAGHLRYYGITDNGTWVSRFRYYATRLVYKWINRRSQRKSYNWKGFNAVLRHVDWPRVKIHHDLNPFQRTRVFEG
jgi:RNA-directed DNA polymerase